MTKEQRQQCQEYDAYPIPSFVDEENPETEQKYQESLRKLEETIARIKEKSRENGERQVHIRHSLI